MIIRCSLLGLILSASSLLGAIHHTVAAQEVDATRFTPLEPGNRWEYSVEQVEGSIGPGSFLRFEVERTDTLTEEQRHAILRIEGFDADTTLLYRRRCAFFIETGAWPNLEPLGDDPDACRLAIPLPPREYLSISLDDTVNVGDCTYIVEATARYGESHSAPGGAGASLDRYFAAEVGVYEHDSETHGRRLHPVGQDHRWIATLTYAEVNGMTYCTEKIETALEQPPGAEDQAPRIAMLYPNPFQREIHFEVEGLQPGAGHVEVLDVTGRRILAREIELGQGPLTLTLEGGPSGVYLLRVTDAFARQVGVPIIRVASQVD